MVLSPNCHTRVLPISVLVIHYTEVDLQKTRQIFLDTNVQLSSHIVLDVDGTVHHFVPDDCVAYHAGQSSWYGVEKINEHSIGIELVHPGMSVSSGLKMEGDPQLWVPYAPTQVQAFIDLCKEYIDKYGIRPENIVGHSDVAPWRYDDQGCVYTKKQDPGPLFPWKILYDQGIGRWYDQQVSQEDVPSLSFVRKVFQALGYRMIEDPQALTAVIRAFQMHYRSSNISGILDNETWSIAKNLIRIDTVHNRSSHSRE